MVTLRRMCTDNSCSHYAKETILKKRIKNWARRYLGKTDINGELSKNGGKLTSVHYVCCMLSDVQFSPSRSGILKYAAPAQTYFSTQKLYRSL